MLCRFFALALTVIVCFSGNSYARVNFSNLKGQNDFLDSLLHDIERKEEEKKLGALKEEEVVRYKHDIANLKKTLKNIDIKSSEVSDELQTLVDEYNKKMKELEKSYKFIMSKLKKQCKHKFSSTHHSLQSSRDTISSTKKRKRIKDGRNFQLLEIVEIKPQSKVEIITKSPEE